MATTLVYDERSGEFVEREIQPPQFNYFRLKDRAFVGRTATIEWSVENASRVELQRVGPQSFVGDFSYPVTEENQRWILIAYGDTEVRQELMVHASQLPSISKFEIGSPVLSKYLIGDKVTLDFIANDCERLILNGDEIPNLGNVEIEITKHRETFVLQGVSGSEIVSKNIVIEAFPRPEITFHSSAQKIRKQRPENATLSWQIINAKSARLIFVGFDRDVPLNGSKSVSPTTDTRYTLKCLALDGEREFTQRLTIKIVPEAEFSFSANPRFSLPGVPVTINWDVTNATSVKIECDFPGAGRVAARGQLVIEPTTDTKVNLKIKDAFGTRRESLEIKMLPLPVVKLKPVLPCITNQVRVAASFVRPQVGVVTPRVSAVRAVPFVPHMKIPQLRPKLELKMPDFRGLLIAHSEQGFSTWKSLINLSNKLFRNLKQSLSRHGE